jgi:hypothetical protein
MKPVVLPLLMTIGSPGLKLNNGWLRLRQEQGFI